MKFLSGLLIFCGILTVAAAQTNPKDLLSELGNLSDQFDNAFHAESFKDKIIIVFVSGADDPFTKVYDKWKGKSLKQNSNVQIVGGFKEMLSGSGHAAPSGGMINHVRDAFTSRYGTKHFPILIDMKSVVGEKLGVKGLSVIVISKKKNKIESVQDFGTDRKKFFDAINPYFNQ